MRNVQVDSEIGKVEPKIYLIPLVVKGTIMIN